jgi:predicted transcriptional regulator
MSLTIELPNETVQSLATIAKGKGKSTEDFAREILENEVLTAKRSEELRQDAQTGLKALEAGEFTDFATAKDFIDDVRREGNRRLAEKGNANK